MRILLTMNLPYHPIHGGANKINRMLAEGLVERGHDVRVIVPTLGVPSRLTHAQFIEELASQGVDVSSEGGVHRFNMNGVTVHSVVEASQLRAHLIHQIEEYRPDWVLVSSEDPSQNLLDAALKICPGKVVYLVHTVSFLPFGPQAFFPSPGRAKLIEQVAGIVSISNYVAGYIRRWGNLESAVIYWPCYGAGPFADFGCFNEGYVTMVNPCAIKGSSIFLSLARALPQIQFAAVKTWGTADGDCAELETLPNVEFLEPCSDFNQILSRTRALLMPSLWEESFGLTVVEAMLRGIPVLAGDIGGIPEAKLGTDFLLPVRPIEHFGERLDENMLPIPIVPDQDITPWQESLCRLLSDHALYEYQSKAAREAALRFVSKLSLDPFEDLLCRLAAQSKADDDRPQAMPDGPIPNEAVQEFGDLFDEFDSLTPEQQSLLMLWLREKAAGEEIQQPETRRIQPAPREGAIPLSYAQERMWFLDQLEPSSPAYVIPALIEITGKLDLGALEESFNRIIARHETLRTSFTSRGGEPVQVISERVGFRLAVIDLRGVEERARGEEVRRIGEQEARRGYDLGEAPLMRAKVITESESRHVLVMSMHHIVSDGWSMGVLIKEMGEVYGGIVEGREARLRELAVQYADYAVWQRGRLTAEVVNEQMKYWRHQLEGAAEVMELPTDRARGAVAGKRGGMEVVKVSREVSEGLKRMSRDEGATLFMSLLGAFDVLLWRYSGAEDVVVGTAVAGRGREEVEGLIGFFVNTLVMRVKVEGDERFEELMRKVKEASLGGYANQEVPFEKVVEEMRPGRGLSHSPMFQVMFALQNAPTESIHLPGLTLRHVEFETDISMFDLSLSVEDTEQGLIGVFKYSADLFDADTIRRMAGHFQNLLESIVADPARPICELEMMGEGERERMLKEWNETAREYPADKCAHELFEQQVRRRPDAVAVSYEGEQLTYGQLNSKANQLAHHLISLGVGPEHVVGICMERSLDMVIGLFGILKAGGAYMPLDPDFPKERLAFILNDAQVSVLLADASLMDRLPGHDAQVVCMDRDRLLISRQYEHNPSSGVTSDNLIYVIYTSGSTGQPKGTMLPHSGVCNCLLWMQHAHQLSELDRVLLKSPLSFDSSVWELFWPLLVGASVVVARPGGQRDSGYLVKVIKEEKVTTVHFVPSMFQIILEEKELESCDSLERVICGGEALPIASVERFFDRLNCELHNFYGPTETSIGSIDWTCERKITSRTVPIGRPISNSECYVLDWKLRAVPIGATGQLYIGGAGLARGYLNRADLTGEKFIANENSRERGERVYATGDEARYRADGSIEFLGRADHQVKIRGVRIELAEIILALNQHPAVRESVAIVSQDAPGDKRLLAYVVRGSEAPIVDSELRAFLRERLPDYMIPSSFIILDKMPLLSSGKVDMRALPAPERRVAAGSIFERARNPIEEAIRDIWSELLRIDCPGIHDNFFELGGHSLLATQIISRVRKIFRIDLPLRSLFEFPTIAEMARMVERILHSGVDLVELPLRPVRREGALPLSYAQERMWFLDQLEPSSAAYVIPAIVEITGKLDLPALEESFNRIIARHETLRTSFTSRGGEPVQVISDYISFNLAVIDLGEIDERSRSEEVRRIGEQEARRGYDLGEAPLMRAKVITESESRHVLVMSMHHIVSDGWSMGVLIKEMGEVYGGIVEGRQSRLRELPVQYADYAVWQRGRLTAEVVGEQMKYWRHQLEGAAEVMELPTDRARGAVASKRGGMEVVKVSREVSEGLKRMSRDEGATLFMSLLGAFDVLLWRYSGAEDVVVGTAVAGRGREEVEGLIGFFVNTLVMRVKVEGDERFAELMRKVKEAALGGYANQEVPFEKVVEEMRPGRGLSHSPMFQVMFALQNAPTESIHLPGLTLKYLPVDSGVAKFDLTLSMWESAEGLEGTLEYNTDLFHASTISRMATYFQNLLESIVADPARPICELEMMGEGERDRMLKEWNETAREYPADKCAHELFEQQVRRRPDAVAVSYEGEQLTYGQLNSKANQLAHFLKSIGVGPEVKVGICIERSPRMIVGLLGILKAGGAYVPLDPTYPKERLIFMLKDAEARVLLTDQRLAEDFSEQEVNVVCLDSDWDAISQQSDENLINMATIDNLAYVIYTSGSTGKPKGIAIPHRGIVRLVFNANYVELRDSDGVAQASNYSFDAATFEIWGALVSGARLVGVTKNVALSPSELEIQIRDQQITVLFLTTALFNQIARELPSAFGSLRCVLFGGEAVDPVWVKKVLTHGAPEQLLHVYGPTESTTFSTFHLVHDVEKDAATIPIGRPISNSECYVLDWKLRAVPIGATGQLYIGGAGLARGYLNRADLTGEKFIANENSRERGERVYATGDEARYRADGSIEFLGRADHQVKIRGFRIELKEIEAALIQHPAVTDAIVIAREDSPGEKRLSAFVVAKEQVTARQLREFLRLELPDYMLPSSIVLVGALPLTPNGKIDRRELLSIDEVETDRTSVAPRDTLEFQLVQIWEEALSVRPIGVTDNFFDLGGHSLLAVRLMARIRSLTGQHLPLDVLLRAPTVERFAKVLRQRGVHHQSPLVKIQADGVRQPLFCVHPAGGNVICYIDLARHVGTDQPLYGLQARGLDGQEGPLTQIEEMATYYIEALRGVQREGPYLLCGWSLGGVVAFEMAQQLRRQGNAVALLALIDSRAPDPRLFDIASDDATLLINLARDIGVEIAMDDLCELGPEEQLNYFLGRGQKDQVIPIDFDLLQISRLFNVYKTNVRAWRDYRPQIYGSRILLFRASEEAEKLDNSDLPDDPTLGWGRLSLEPVEVRAVPGNHTSMIAEPNVQFLADELKRCISKARENNATWA